MTEEMIRSITEAEAQATEIKRLAEEKAAQISADAVLSATRTEKSSDDVCKAYRETQIKTARAEAEIRYNAALATAEKQAREYCAEILKNSDASVSEIVGRIISGDR